MNGTEKFYSIPLHAPWQSETRFSQNEQSGANTRAKTKKALLKSKKGATLRSLPDKLTKPSGIYCRCIFRMS